MSSVNRFALLVALSLGCISMSYGLRKSFIIMADQGETCRDACITRNSECDMEDWREKELQEVFKSLKIACDYDERTWWTFDQPSVVVDPLDDNFGRCLGWKNKTEVFDCSARWPTVRRICQCSMDFECPRVLV